MVRQELRIDYLPKGYLDALFPNRNNTPYFQLFEEDYSKKADYIIVSKPTDFPALAFGILQYLKLLPSLKNTYFFSFTESALSQLQKNEKQVLEEILALHNSFTTPKRTK